MTYKLAKLNLFDPHKSLKTGEMLFQKAEEDQTSDLLVLVEVDSAQPDRHSFIQNFLSLIFEVYEQSTIEDTEKILENILKRLNQELSNSKPKKDRGYAFQSFIGLIKENNIYFSSYGNVETFLIKSTMIKQISQKEFDPGSSLFFDHTLKGQLKDDDRLLIATESLTDYLSLEKIKKIISALPPQSASAHLSNILETVPKTVSFFGLILQFITAESSAENKEMPKIGRLATPSGSKNSLDQLLRTQAETEKIMTPPSFIDSLKNKLKKSGNLISVKAKAGNQTAEKINKNKAGNKNAAIKKYSSYLLSTWQFLTSGKFRYGSLSSINSLLRKQIKRFYGLSKFKRILILVAVLIVLILSQSLVWQGKQLETAADQEFYQDTLVKINEKRSGIEASLIYNDTVRAKQLLGEIEVLLNQLPQNSKERIAEHNRLQSEVKTVFEKVWKITNIAEPVSLINFRNFDLTTEVIKIGLKDNYLYGFNNTSKLFTVSTVDDQTKIYENLDLSIKNVGYFEKIDNFIIQSNDNRFYTINDDEILEITANLPAELSQIDGLAFYLDKVYLLDKTSKQIFRLTYLTNSFGRPTGWLREELPIDQTNDLAVDGYIYTLQNDGKILKLSQGGRENYSEEIKIEPVLNSASKIFTTEDSQNLYILDPAGRRFIILDKETVELKQQYFSDKFNNLKDFIIDEAGSKVYLLNGAQVFVVAI